ncbi:MAG: Gfo/Idh/MocA family oxidoreductase [Ignavibacteria bacterium]
MSEFSVSIIGCGDIGFSFDHNKKTEGALSHFKAFNSSEYFEVKAVAEIKKDVRDIIENEYKISVYDDYKRMLNENKFDVIVIATDDSSHFEILKNIIPYKPKLVFSEKPLALNFEDVKEICDLYEKSKIHLQVNYTRRFLKEFYEVEQFIKSKRIGELESATFYYSRGLIHNASHYLDLVNWYIGETEKNLIKISEKAGISSDDNTVSFDIFYENGLEIRFIGLNPSKLTFAEIDLVGSKGRVKVNYKNEIEKYNVTENKLFNGYTSYELTETIPIKYSNALPNAVENIYGVLTGHEKLKSPADNSLKIFELIKRIKEKPLCQN